MFTIHTSFTINKRCTNFTILTIQQFLQSSGILKFLLVLEKSIVTPQALIFLSNYDASVAGGQFLHNRTKVLFSISWKLLLLTERIELCRFF